MHFEAARSRLLRLPQPLPAARPDLEPTVLSVGASPERVRLSTPGPSREAASLVLVYPDATGEARIVLLVRTDDGHVHAGQVALPGGAREPGDAFPEGTALREAAEEVGLDAIAAGVRTTGCLETVDVRVSGFLMVPVVALAEREPRLRADAREVAELLRVPLWHFLPDAPVEIVEEQRDGWHLRYGAFPVGDHRVWGATGRVLGQLGAVLAGRPAHPGGRRGS